MQQTWIATSDPSFPFEMKIFDQQINASMRRTIPSRLSHTNQQMIRFYKKVQFNSLDSDVRKCVIKYTNNRSYNLFKTVFFEQQRFASDRTDVYRKTNDGCLMYNLNNSPAIGFLQTIISFNNDDEPILIIRPVNLLSTADSMIINQRIYRCTNVLYGTTYGTTLEVINLESIIQKLAFRPGSDIKSPPVKDSMFFFQYPNLSGST